MKIFSALTISLLIIFQAVGFAAKGTFSASGEYLMSDYDTPEIAEKIALDFAKQSAAEQAGVYLESYSRSVNFKLETDEIKTVASSKVEILEKNISRQTQRDGRILLRADIKATVDTSELDNFLALEHEKRQLTIQQYKILQERNGKIKQDIDALQKKLAVIKDEVKDDELIVEQERINREFLSMQEVVNFNRAIWLNPKNTWAYVVHSLETPLNPNLKDIDKTIIIEPNNSTLHGMRGHAYMIAGASKKAFGGNADVTQYLDRALKSYNRAIELTPNDAQAYINRGNLYSGLLNDHDKALADYNTAIKLDPKNGKGYKSLGEFCRELKEYSKALEYYKLALKLNEKDFSVTDYISLGSIYEELRDYPHALESYNKIIHTNSRFDSDDRMSAYSFRAKVYMKMGEYDKAIADCDKGIELANSAQAEFWISSLTRTKEKTIGLKDIVKVIKGNGKTELNDPEALINRAADYSKKAKFELAVKDCMQAVAINPKILYKYESTVSSHIIFLGDEKVALDCMNKLLKINPKSSTLHNNRGIFYEQLGDKEKALADFNKAFELAPTSEITRKNIMRLQDIDKYNELENLLKRADSFKEKQNYPRAIEEYTKVLALDPKNQDAYFERGFLYEDLGEYQKALADYNKLIELNPNYDSNTYNNRGVAYENLGDKEKALADYKKALELKPSNDTARKNIMRLQYGDKYNELENLLERADSFRSDKNYPRAIEEYTKVLALDPKNQDAYFWRAWIYNELGEYEKTVTDYDKLIELNPKYSSDAYNNRGTAYFELKQYDKAIADYERAIETGLINVTYYKNLGDCYRLKKDYPQAIKEYTTAINFAIFIGGNNQNAYFWRGWIYGELGEHEKAIIDYDKLIELNPNHSSEAYNNRGFAYENLGNYDKALADYNKALELDPNNEIAKNNRRHVLDKMKK